MRGLAAELRGARDWMKVATAWLVGESGISPYTCTIKNRLEFYDFLLQEEASPLSNITQYIRSSQCNE